jgi:glutathione S-transferase
MRRLYYHQGIAGRPPRVRWALEEVGAPYEWLELTPEQLDSPEYRAHQPLGKVPFLIDDDGTLFESAALCLQIADQFPQANLIGALGSRERGLVYQWTLFAMTDLESAMILVLRQRRAAPDVAATAAALERFLAAVDVIEQALATHDYIVGDRFTIADIVLCGVLKSAVRRELFKPAARVGEYYELLTARPAYTRAYA